MSGGLSYSLTSSNMPLFWMGSTNAVPTCTPTVMPFMSANDLYCLLSSLGTRSEEHTSELQSLMRISYAVFCLNNNTTKRYPIKNINKNTHSSRSSATAVQSPV